MPLPKNGDAMQCCRTVLVNPLVKGGQREVYHESEPTLAGTPCRTSVLRGLEETHVATC